MRVNRASTKMELNNAKKRPPTGDAKKSATSNAVPIVGKIAWICSNEPLGPDGGSWYPILIEVVVVVRRLLFWLYAFEPVFTGVRIGNTTFALD